jgi:hypothetical protein
VWNHQLPISPTEHVSITNGINTKKDVTRDTMTNPSFPIVARDPPTGRTQAGSTSHSEPTTRIGTRSTVPISSSDLEITSAERGSSAPAGLGSTTFGPVLSDEVRQILRRAESLRSASVSDGPQVTDLQRRLRELAPPEEVLQALQGILRVDNEVNVDLPEYEEGSRR